MKPDFFFRFSFRPVLIFLLLFVVLAGCRMPEGPVRLSGDVPEALGWQAVTVLEGLEHPWAVAWISEDELLITERPGRLRIVRDGVLLPDPVAGVPPVFADGQGGLLDLTLHPDFEENRLVYLTYAAGDRDANRTTVARGVFDGSSLTAVEVIFETNVAKTGNQHFGSRMAWLPGNELLVSIADGGNYIRFDGGWIREQAQNRRNHLGTVVRLTDAGRAAQGAPFTEAEAGEDVLPEIWTWGHRNIQGLAYDPVSGRVWANEHGARGGDELNLLTEGSNFGWPLVTYSREYHFTRISRKTKKPGKVDPLVVWTPAQAPSGLAVYHGEVFPEWQGNLFSGGLVSGEIRRIMLEGETVVGEEKLTIGDRVRDVRVGPDGHLYVLTDESNGRLIRIERG
ncbi:Glucose/arabinose dehydrogenase, beta-propeller fold [Cyclonatronum proteinivorum]|uniref:Glucose/arabinose dehydrogenase, beta-propeller fold n=1 Tax=Cyclonatronum proteinivorum TaxID=1457365 RepID=A0A345UI22_9BACT|nr:PQQ-dependent sugar dehydrogenase [Cyclonatronum proteinivorum]AXJ00124.1 Glucose/arabinose dehydrogenase, beta-propeller fold [Cyclonatronum proteinivorum]